MDEKKALRIQRQWDELGEYMDDHQRLTQVGKAFGNERLQYHIFEGIEDGKAVFSEYWRGDIERCSIPLNYFFASDEELVVLRAQREVKEQLEREAAEELKRKADAEAKAKREAEILRQAAEITARREQEGM